ncbi:MAG: hypothetical protein H5T61_05040 [Thermoflexales bacterium]|nr:hypothetical protein [Thermoflexales bacterium]
MEETGPDAQAAPLPCRALAAGASLPALSAGVGVEVVAPLTAGGEVVPAEELARQYEDYLLLHDESRNLTWVLPKDFFGPYGIDPQTADGRLLSALLSSHPAGSVVMGEDFSRLTSGLQVNDGYLVVPIGENQLLVFGKNINGQMRGYRLYHREGETRWFAHDLGVPWNPKLTDVVFDPSSGQAVALSGYRIIHRYDLKNRSWQWLGGKDGEFVVVGDQRLQTATMLSALTGRCEENYSGWETLENLYSLDPEDVAALVSYLREGKPSERISVQETETYAVYHTETVSVFVDRRGEEGKQAYFILAHSQAPQLYETFLKLWQRMISENWFSPEFLYHITAQYGANVGGYQTKIDLGPRAASHTVFSCGKDRLVIGVAYYHKNYDNLEGMLNVFLGEAREIFVDQFFQTAPPIKTYPNDLPEKIEIGGYWFTVNPEVRERWQNREPLFVVAFDYNFWEREVVKDSNCPDRVKRQMLDILDGQLQTLVGDYLLNLR